MSVKGISPQKADEPKKGGRLRGCMRWALYLFLGFIGLAVLSAILGGGEEESGAEVAPTLTQAAVVGEAPIEDATPAAVVAEVATATPVALPSDTATVESAAAGLVLEPTDTPTVVLSSVTNTYPDLLAEVADNYENVLWTIADQAALVDQDRAVMQTENWRLVMAAAMVLLEISNEELRSAEPPPEYAEAHDWLMLVGQHFDLAVDELVRGIDDQDLGMFASGLDTLIGGMDSLQEAGLSMPNGGMLDDSVLALESLLGVASAAAVNQTANLRAGPGTSFEVVGSMAQGETARIVGLNWAGDWYQLDSGAWIADFLVDDAPIFLPITWEEPAVVDEVADDGAIEEVVVDDPTPPSPTAIVVDSGRQAAQVVRVVDGDTIEVAMDGVTYPLRYILMNTPETGQHFGAEATERNRQLVEGQTVLLERDVSEVDQYGRLLRYVYLQDGRMVNETLVREGFAEVATYPPDVRHEQRMRAAMTAAVDECAGLWACPDLPGVAVTLSIIENFSENEILGLQNGGGQPVDVSGWVLDGSKGTDFCTVPGGTLLQPGAVFEVATGDSLPGAFGMKCGSKPIWNNSGETIFLRAADGVLVGTIESRKVGG